VETSAKQDRSKERINKIIDAAIEIVEDGEIDDLTLAKVAETSGLKRTSTYKFIPTVDFLKRLIISKCIDECLENFSKNILSDRDKGDLIKVTNYIIFNIYEYFFNSSIAQKLILSNTINPPLDSDSIRQLGSVIQETYEESISLENVFNKEGVCRVVAQIILSIFSLNTKESGKLNDVGKIEASRAVVAYMTSWTKK
jgi:AcrR family transcriptional regulator